MAEAGGMRGSGRRENCWGDPRNDSMKSSSFLWLLSDYNIWELKKNKNKTKLTPELTLHIRLFNHTPLLHVAFSDTCNRPCSGLNICVSHTFICWSPNSQYDVIRRWGLREIVRFRWGYEGWSEVKSLSRVLLFATPWIVALHAPPSMGFSRQEYWSGLPFPSPEDIPNPGIEPGSPTL